MLQRNMYNEMYININKGMYRTEISLYVNTSYQTSIYIQPSHKDRQRMKRQKWRRIEWDDGGRKGGKVRKERTQSVRF